MNSIFHWLFVRLGWPVQMMSDYYYSASTVHGDYWHPNRNPNKSSANLFNPVSPSPSISTGTRPEPQPLLPPQFRTHRLPGWCRGTSALPWQSSTAFALYPHCPVLQHSDQCDQSCDANVKKLLWTMEWLLLGLVCLFCQVMHICGIKQTLGGSNLNLLGNHARRSAFSHLELCVVIMFFSFNTETLEPTGRRF